MGIVVSHQPSAAAVAAAGSFAGRGDRERWLKEMAQRAKIAQDQINAQLATATMSNLTSRRNASLQAQTQRMGLDQELVRDQMRYNFGAQQADLEAQNRWDMANLEVGARADFQERSFANQRERDQWLGEQDFRRAEDDFQRKRALLGDEQAFRAAQHDLEERAADRRMFAQQSHQAQLQAQSQSHAERMQDRGFAADEERDYRAAGITAERDFRQNQFQKERDEAQDQFTLTRDALQNQYGIVRDEQQNIYQKERDDRQNRFGIGRDAIQNQYQKERDKTQYDRDLEKIGVEYKQRSDLYEKQRQAGWEHGIADDAQKRIGSFLLNLEKNQQNLTPEGRRVYKDIVNAYQRGLEQVATPRGRMELFSQIEGRIHNAQLDERMMRRPTFDEIFRERGKDMGGGVFGLVDVNGNIRIEEIRGTAQPKPPTPEQKQRQFDLDYTRSHKKLLEEAKANPDPKTGAAREPTDAEIRRDMESHATMRGDAMIREAMRGDRDVQSAVRTLYQSPPPETQEGAAVMDQAKSFLAEKGVDPERAMVVYEKDMYANKTPPPRRPLPGTVRDAEETIARFKDPKIQMSPEDEGVLNAAQLVLSNEARFTEKEAKAPQAPQPQPQPTGQPSVQQPTQADSGQTPEQPALSITVAEKYVRDILAKYGNKVPASEAATYNAAIKVLSEENERRKGKK
jgi:hypothetical protein